MVNRFWLILFAMLLLSGCGWDGTPTRPNDFTPLTSITISAVSSTIANGTSTKLTATGHYSGQFSRDVTEQAVWSSASPAVADFKHTTAPNINRVTAVAPGTAVVTATVEGVSAPYTVTVSSATIQNMTITPATVSVANGLTTQFEAKGVFSDTSIQNLTFDATWTVTKISDPIAASISNDPASKGLAKGLAEGSATISAAFGGIATSPTATLTVTPAILQSITVTPANSSIVGFSKTVTFVAKGTYSDGTISDITTASWSSSAPGVASIIASSGVATTVAEGTTIITATLNGINGRTNLTVTAPVLSANGLQITPANPVLPVGTSLQLALNATFNDGSAKDVAANGTTWTSNSITATVNATGLVSGGNIAGSAIITAQYGGQFATTIVRVQ